MLRKLIREATTRGMCVLESIGIIALGFSANATQEVLRPVAHSSGRHHVEVILSCRSWWTFDDRNKRSC